MPSRRSRLTEDELAAVARGQFVRPDAGIPGLCGALPARGPGDALVAIAAAEGDRLAPDKVFVDAAGPAAARDAADAGTMDVVEGVESLDAGHGRCSSSSASSMGSTAGTPTCWSTSSRRRPSAALGPR